MQSSKDSHRVCFFKQIFFSVTFKTIIVNIECFFSLRNKNAIATSKVLMIKRPYRECGHSVITVYIMHV